MKQQLLQKTQEPIFQRFVCLPTVNINEDFLYDLDPLFIEDLFSMSRRDFVVEYSGIFPFATSMKIPHEVFSDGYADLRGVDLFEIPSAKRDYTSNDQATLISGRARDYMLFLDGLTFKEIFHDTTKEHMIYLMVRDAFYFYDNYDEALTTEYLLQKTQQVLESKEKAQPIKRSFFLDTAYWQKLGIPLSSATQIVKEKLKSYDIGEMYDLLLTIEENLEVFKSMGLTCSKKRLIEWCDENNVEYVTDLQKRRQERDNAILSIFNEDTSRSVRDVLRICKERGVKTNRDNVANVLKSHRI